MNIVMGYNDNPAEPQSRLICRFYQRGQCRFGNRCRNVHEYEHVERRPLKIKTPEAKKEAKTPETRRETSQPKPENKSPCSSASNASSLSPSKSKKTLEFGPSTSTTSSGSAAEGTQSSSKSCGICFDTVTEKKERKDQMFGILPNCNHCFCFSCIKKWRQSKEFDFDVSKACPECRVASSYVYPSKIWFELKEQKENFITQENNRMQRFDCKYYRKGMGTCPFGNTCLYLHALPNGKKMDVGPPKPRRRRNSDMDHELVHQILYLLNDDDEIDLDDVDNLDEYGLDLNDPEIAMQYYDHGDIRRYIAMDRLMNPGSDSEDSDEYDFPLFL